MQLWTSFFPNFARVLPAGNILAHAQAFGPRSRRMEGIPAQPQELEQVCVV